MTVSSTIPSHLSISDERKEGKKEEKEKKNNNKNKYVKFYECITEHFIPLVYCNKALV